MLKGPPDGWHGRVAHAPHVTVVNSEQPQEWDRFLESVMLRERFAVGTTYYIPRASGNVDVNERIIATNVEVYHCIPLCYSLLSSSRCFPVCRHAW